MARARQRSTEETQGRHHDLAEPAVVPADKVVLVTVRVAEGVETYHEGKLVKPGDTFVTDLGTASVQMMEGHGEIVGKAEVKEGKQ